MAIVRIVFTTVAFVAFVIALSTTHMITTTIDNGNFKTDATVGWFEACTSTSGPNVDESSCTTYSSRDCTLIGNVNNSDRNCSQFAGAKIVGIIATIMAGLAMSIFVVLAVADKLLPDYFVRIGYWLVFWSAAAGATATGLYVDLVKDVVANDNFRYGFSFGLFVAAFSLVSRFLSINAESDVVFCFG